MELGRGFYVRRILWMNLNVEYKTAVFILNTMREKLDSQKRLLIAQQKDNGCPMKNYQNTLDLCEELEYAIQQMEKLT